MPHVDREIIIDTMYVMCIIYVGKLGCVSCGCGCGWCIFPSFLFFKYFFKILFIHLTERETASERGSTSSGRGGGRSRLPVEEPDMGLDPRMLGSLPEPKADT